MFAAHRLLVVCLLLLSLLATASDATPSSYTVRDLFPLAKYNSQVADINNLGEVIGFVEVRSQINHSMIWRNGTVTDLGDLGGGDTRAYALNDRGQVTGYSRQAPYSYERTFIWENGVMNMTPDLGGLNSHGNDINESGVIAGYSQTNISGPGHAFTYDGTTVRDLGKMDGVGSHATAINDLGVVAGYSNGSSGAYSAYVWDSSGAHRIDVPGSTYTSPAAINNSSVVVGYTVFPAYYGYYHPHAFVWKNGVMTDLGNSGPDYSAAYDVNEYGLIVGSCGWPTGPEERAAVWENGQLTDLNTLISPDSGWTLINATTVNDNGWIAGRGLYNGEYRGFLLTPVPEPSSFAALFCGLGAMTGAMLRRNRAK